MNRVVRMSLCAVSLMTIAGAAMGQDVFPFSDEDGNGDNPGSGPWLPPEIQSPYYSVTEVPTLGGLESYATAISNTGWIVGGAKDASGVTKAYRFRDGVISNLGSLPGLTYSSANDVNDSGDVAGVSAAAANLWGSTAQPWICRGGWQWTDLDPFNRGVYACATGINASGRVVGTNSVVGTGTLDAFTWTSGAPQIVATLPGDTCRITYGQGINDAGVAVGYTAAPGACGSNQAVKIVNGHAFALPGLGGENSVAEAVNQAGDIVGTAELPTGQNRAVIWRNGVVQNLGTLVGSSFSMSINTEGSVVGYYIDSRNQQRAFVILNGNMFDLNALVPANSGWRLLIATDINENGEIVGQGRNPQGRLRGFKLTPPCRSDFNGDGGIDGVDVEAFFAAWEAGQDVADMNMDGGVDGNDVGVFFTLWDAGRC